MRASDVAVGSHCATWISVDVGQRLLCYCAADGALALSLVLTSLEKAALFDSNV